MEIQQHDGVVVEVAGSRQGFAKRKRGGEVLQGEREAPGAVVLQPSLPPPLFIGALGGTGSLEIPSPWAGAPPGTYIKGGGGRAAHNSLGRLPPPLQHLSLSRRSSAKPCCVHCCIHHHAVVLLDLHQPLLPPCWIKKEETSR